jgi:hypothetical protein
LDLALTCTQRQNGFGAQTAIEELSKVATKDTAAFEVECETARLSATIALARLAGTSIPAAGDMLDVQLGQTCDFVLLLFCLFVLVPI